MGDDPSSGAVSEALDRDVACGVCGYNLRGLRPEGLCPECGSPILPSLTPFFAQVGPRYLRRMIWGVRLIFGLPLLLLAPVLWALNVEWLLYGLCFSYGAGLWLLGSRPGKTQWVSARLRWCVRASALGSILLALAAWDPGWLDFLDNLEWFPSRYEFLGNYWVVPLLPGMLASGVVLTRLARRIGSHDLHRQAARDVWLLAAVVATWPALQIAFGQWPGRGRFSSPIPEALTAALLLVGVWFNLLLGRFEQVFRQGLMAAKSATAGRSD